MKLRILDNSIRLRLTQSEVERIVNDGLVKGHVGFSGNHSFSYSLESSPACVSVEAHISNNALTVRVPEAEIHAWATTEDVSIEADQVLDHEASLKILVEKDFACLAPREGTDESDMFPHPQDGKDQC